MHRIYPLGVLVSRLFPGRGVGAIPRNCASKTPSSGGRRWGEVRQYVLIGKDGMLVHSGMRNDPPTEAEVEALLKADGS